MRVAAAVPTVELEIYRPHHLGALPRLASADDVRAWHAAVVVADVLVCHDAGLNRR